MFGSKVDVLAHSTTGQHDSPMWDWGFYVYAMVKKLFARLFGSLFPCWLMGAILNSYTVCVPWYAMWQTPWIKKTFPTLWNADLYFPLWPILALYLPRHICEGSYLLYMLNIPYLKCLGLKVSQIFLIFIFSEFGILEI